jgi:pimeloyl-ACP methyl ester carboxylesterase
LSSVVDVLAAHLPTARRLVLPGAEHSTLLEPSDTLLSAVQAFLGAEDRPA